MSIEYERPSTPGEKRDKQEDRTRVKNWLDNKEGCVLELGPHDYNSLITSQNY